ncbi:MAG: lipocalin-like domain-containing protein [Chloroflexi bacterium]|nr:lipocalin-like domain-containing protein [Chloroflexota bacterium]
MLDYDTDHHENRVIRRTVRCRSIGQAFFITLLGESGWGGIVLFTDSQYHYLITRDDRPAGTDKDSPDSELAELFRTTSIEVGSYRKSDGSLILTPDIAMNPADQGSETSVSFNLNEQELEFEVGGRMLAFEKVD